MFAVAAGLLLENPFVCGAQSGRRGKLKRDEDYGEDVSGSSEDESHDDVPTVAPVDMRVPGVAEDDVEAALPDSPGPSVAVLPPIIARAGPGAGPGPVRDWPAVAGGARSLITSSLPPWAVEGGDLTSGQQWGHLKATLGTNVKTAEAVINTRFMRFCMDMLTNGENLWPLIQEDAIMWEEQARHSEGQRRLESRIQEGRDAHARLYRS